MYEIHVAIPQILNIKEVMEELAYAGLEKGKLFLAVHNTPKSANLRPGTPPTGHDLHQPGAMTTAKTKSADEGARLVRAGMQVLRMMGIEGNFEVEEIMGLADPFPTSLLSEFEVVPDSPDYENHIIWKGITRHIPTIDEVSRLVEEVHGYMPHQIVDFGTQDGYNGKISRVATIYQPTANDALQCDQILQLNLHQLRCAYAIAEKVAMVGQWPK